MSDGVARWLLTAVFTGTGLYYLGRITAAARHRRPFVDEGLHALMSAAMIAMWRSWAAPAIVYVTVFTAAVLWFVARALFTMAGSGQPPEDGHHGHRAALWYHAGMMASMAWMAVAMSGAATDSAAGTGSAGPAGGDVTAMAGMGMSPTGSAGAGAMTTGTHPSWVTLPCLILVVGFAAATGWLATNALRPARARNFTFGWRAPSVSNLVGALMAAGMAVSFYEMI